MKPIKNQSTTLIFFLSYGWYLTGSSIHFEKRADLPENRPIIFTANHQSMFDIPGMIWFLRTYHPLVCFQNRTGQRNSGHFLQSPRGGCRPHQPKGWKAGYRGNRPIRKTHSRYQRSRRDFSGRYPLGLIQNEAFPGRWALGLAQKIPRRPGGTHRHSGYRCF